MAVSSTSPPTNLLPDVGLRLELVYHVALSTNSRLELLPDSDL